MRKLLGSGLLVATLSIACVKTGSAVERVPISQDITQYRTASAQLDIPHDVKDPQKVKDRFFETLGEELADRKLFRLQGDGADLLIKVHVTHVEAGSRAAMAFNVGGDAEIAATVELVDLRQQKTIGVFDVTGNSKKQGQHARRRREHQGMGRQHGSSFRRGRRRDRGLPREAPQAIATRRVPASR